MVFPNKTYPITLPVDETTYNRLLVIFGSEDKLIHGVTFFLQKTAEEVCEKNTNALVAKNGRTNTATANYA